MPHSKLILAIFLILFPHFILLAQNQNFIFPISSTQTIGLDPAVTNSGTYVVSFNDVPLRAFCWDGITPSFAIEYAGDQFIEILDGNNYGIVINPDVIIDPRNLPTVNIIVAYTVDPDGDVNSGVNSTVRYEAWEFDGTALSLIQPSTPVNSIMPSQYQPHIDVSIDGKAVIVFNNTANTEVNAIGDVAVPSALSLSSLVEFECIQTCFSDRPDVAVKTNPTTNSTMVSVSFIDYENVPNSVNVHTFDFTQIGLSGTILCDILDSAIYVASGPDYFIGYPRIDGPDFANNSSYTHVNDYQLAVDVIEDWDIGLLEHILTYT
ncbi:MAG: hypothetical protein RLP15_07070, partial [Cryomorphaceae bacterium]